MPNEVAHSSFEEDLKELLRLEALAVEVQKQSDELLLRMTSMKPAPTTTIGNALKIRAASVHTRRRLALARQERRQAGLNLRSTRAA